MKLTPRQAERVAREVLGPEAAPSADPEVEIPQRIGRYRIRRVIASGGMGTVYEAEQDHPHRTVAVKVMKRGLASKQVFKRFEFESDLLAHLNHPGIAQVFDAGRYDDGFGGVPYFVMELIPNAKPITDFADERCLDLRERLELFVRVCDAVHHGHQKGIIHRDLKPANILVGSGPGPSRAGGEDAAEATVKVIDFGVARATDSDIAVTTMQTDVNQLVGTLQYMSPEQCEGSALELDTRSDVYSLGVVLYELLCGRLPYELNGSSIAAAARTIQEAEPPNPGTIRRKLRGPLATIILKALEKDRERRYQSAAELGAEIKRYVRGEPIEAHPPGVWMRCVRWIGRHPIVATTGACIAMFATAVVSVFLTVQITNRAPYRIELSEDGQHARLFALSGRLLKDWDATVTTGIHFADLLPSSEGASGHAVVLLAFDHRAPMPYRSSLCAFTSGDWVTPAWRSRVEAGDIPEALRDETDTAFSANAGWLIDVDANSPGHEVIVAFTHWRSGLTLVRVLSADGAVLRQYWRDGHVIGCHWVPGSRMLVFIGIDSSRSWYDWGYGDSGDILHPHVLFAVRPESLSQPSDLLRPEDCEWYLFVDPFDWTVIFDHFSIAPPPPTQDSTNSFEVRFRLQSTASRFGPGLTWCVNDHGEEIPGSRDWDDQFERAPGSPDPFLLQMRPWPPRGN